MVRIKILKLSHLIYTILIIAAVILIIFFAVKLFTRPAVKNMSSDIKVGTSEIKKYSTNVSRGETRQTSNNSGPAKSETSKPLSTQKPISKNTQKINVFTSMSEWLFKMFIHNPKGILNFQIPVLSAVSNKQAVQTLSQVTPNENKGEIYLKNDDIDLPDEIKIEIAKIKPDDFKPIDLTGNGPQIMIYHSHSRESYKESYNGEYTMTGDFRTTDKLHSVIRVGDELAKCLHDKYGIEVLHSRQDHELPYEAAYSKSLQTVLAAIKQYPSLKMFIDLHRDAYGNVKNKDMDVVTINGKRTAKVTVIIGTGTGVTGAGFKERPNWKENYKLGVKITDALNKAHPGIANPVGVQSGRYNQHVSPNAILFEVGSDLTTLDEALATVPYLAEAVHQVFK